MIVCKFFRTSGDLQSIQDDVIRYINNAKIKREDIIRIEFNAFERNQVAHIVNSVMLVYERRDV